MLVKVRRFISAHPLLFLILLSPQVEYLTGSSQLSWLIGSPPLFFAFFFQNLGSYGLAVVLIREAKIRWQKGWASILLLGAAYGILNEGIGAATLFNPDTTAFGGIGTYGRWLGVNWVWATGLVVLVHPLFSVSLPILMFGLALPQTRGKNLVGKLGLHLALLGLGIDALGTLLFVGTIRHFFAGAILWASSCAIMVALVCAARIVPKELLKPRSNSPRIRPLVFSVIGAAFFWAASFGGGSLANLNTPPLIVALFLIALGVVTLRWIFTNIGQSGNGLQKVALSAGLIASLMPQGFFGQLGTGIGIVPVVAYDALTILLLNHLRKRNTPARIERNSDPRPLISRPDPHPPASSRNPRNVEGNCRSLRRNAIFAAPESELLF